jgi:Domain of unknown function (DUF4160)
VKLIVAKLQAQGLRSPYLRNYVVARIDPVRFIKVKKGDTAPPMTVPQALVRMSAAAKIPNPLTLPEISRFLGVAIFMYYNDHAPPHVHARYPRRARQHVVEWIECIGESWRPCGSWRKSANRIQTGKHDSPKRIHH